MQTFYTVRAHVSGHGTPKGGLILLHEAFGLTPHIRRIADHFAGLGYTVIAPDMLELAVPQAEREDAAWQSDGIYTWLSQKQTGLDIARPLITSIKPEQMLALLQACVAKLDGLPVATLGYCWGGSVSFVAAKQLPGLKCAVAYYGGRIAELAAQPPAPQVPVLAHLAKLDRYIPFEAAMTSLKEHTPDVEAYGYDADHGFNRDDGPVYKEAAAKLALERTLAFFDKHMK
jgi:carboxymethylenebutenolidase